MKRAFTLVELMTVAGLIGLLATVSVVSWGAVSKGRADRAAHEALEGFVRSALRVAATDGTRVVLRFRTHRIPAGEDFGEERRCRAVAIRAVGRVSAIEDGHPWDEFADEGSVRLDETPAAYPLAGDVATWKVGDPYGRAIATMELPHRYFVADGDVTLLPTATDTVTMSGSISLSCERPDGRIETVGTAIAAGRWK